MTPTAADALHILLAEDEPLNQRMAQLVLNKLGYRADTASNGWEAVLALECQAYDLVLMDIQMPEMNGIEAIRIIRERWPQGPKIIVVTSLTPESCRKLCLEVGADDFLNKPVKVNELGAAIERSCAHACAGSVC